MNSSLGQLQELKLKLANIVATDKIREEDPGTGTHEQLGTLWFPKEAVVQQAKRAKIALAKLKGPFNHKVRWRHGNIGPPKEC